jgi:hypothetical protein
MANPNWIKGQSGNPSGRPTDPAKQEVLDIFKKAAPNLLLLAIKRAEKGDNALLAVLVKKALPDSLKIEGELSVFHSASQTLLKIPGIEKPRLLPCEADSEAQDMVSDAENGG